MGTKMASLSLRMVAFRHMRTAGLAPSVRKMLCRAMGRGCRRGGWAGARPTTRPVALAGYRHGVPHALWVHSMHTCRPKRAAAAVAGSSAVHDTTHVWVGGEAIALSDEVGHLLANQRVASAVLWVTTTSRGHGEQQQSLGPGKGQECGRGLATSTVLQLSHHCLG